ncbi:MAG: hypothetical protein M3O67_00995 [Bacteroidota bacterium]|nr:hypothetical protein [Bacteroidota bacterium]
MRSKTSTPIGALHPILFFIGVYVVALFFSIFICSSIFYSLNPELQAASKKLEKLEKQSSQGYSSNVASLP